MLRKAKIKDIKQMHALVNSFAKQNLMLARSLNELYENLRDFWVIEKKNKIIGCCALHVSWDTLVEVKSLAVHKNSQKKGLGTKLVNACVKEARAIGAKKGFALTYSPGFFRKLGFRKIPHEQLPHKIWAECIKCPKFPNCDETALIKKL
mgnify:CR=1 FL=1